MIIVIIFLCEAIACLILKYFYVRKEIKNLIRLEVEDYCQSCTEFNPDVEEPTALYANREVVARTDTVVRCKSRHKCENIKMRIEQDLRHILYEEKEKQL